MKHAMPALALAALTLSFAAAQSPATPDLSGTWTMDATRSQSPVQNEPVKSMTLVVKHTPSDLSIETTRDGRPQTITYRRGSPEALVDGAARTGTLAAIFYVEGSKLVTEAVSDVNGMTVRHKAIYTLDAAGAELTVESLTVVEHGYTIRGGQNYGFVKDIFKKTAP
jgi:hypothetical protein